MALRLVVNASTLPDALYRTPLCGFSVAFYCHRDLTGAHTTTGSWLLAINETYPP